MKRNTYKKVMALLLAATMVTSNAASFAYASVADITEHETTAAETLAEGVAETDSFAGRSDDVAVNITAEETGVKEEISSLGTAEESPTEETESSEAVLETAEKTETNAPAEGDKTDAGTVSGAALETEAIHDEGPQTAETTVAAESPAVNDQENTEPKTKEQDTAEEKNLGEEDLALKEDAVYIRGYQEDKEVPVKASLWFPEEGLAVYEKAIGEKSGCEAKIVLPITIQDERTEITEGTYRIEFGGAYMEELSGTALYHYDKDDSVYTKLAFTYSAKKENLKKTEYADDEEIPDIEITAESEEGSDVENNDPADDKETVNAEAAEKVSDPAQDVRPGTEPQDAVKAEGGTGKDEGNTAEDTGAKETVAETEPEAEPEDDAWRSAADFFAGQPDVITLEEKDSFPSGQITLKTEELGTFFFVYEKEEAKPAFSQEADLGDIIVSVKADEGVFPEGAVLKVEKIEAAPEVEAAVTDAREAKRKVAKAYTFDIKVFDKNGNENQPQDGSKVHVSFKLPEAANENLESSVYHIKEETETVKAEKLDAETEDDIVTAVTDGFSYYTVEFLYEDIEYVLQGGEEIRLSELLTNLGLSGDAQSWAVSNTDLFDVYLGDENGVIYDFEPVNEDESRIVPVNNGTVPWLLSLAPFSTQEWLKVTIDEVEYEIIVTDDDTSNTVPVEYKGQISTYHDGNVAVTADEYVLESDLPSIVKQPKDDTTTVYDFAAGAPLSTIYIDEQEIGPRKGAFAYETTDQNIRNAIVHDDTSTDTNYCNSVYYDPRRIGEHLLNGQANTLNGPLFSFTFDDAAIMPDGTKANLKITYSNVNIFTDERLYAMENVPGLTDAQKENAYYDGAVYIAQGSVIKHEGGDRRNLTSTAAGFTETQVTAATNAYKDRVRLYRNKPGLSGINETTYTNQPSLGKSVDVTYQVVDDSGEPVNGTFLYAIVGINLERDPYGINNHNAGRGLWWVHDDYPDMHFFNEQIAVTNNTIASDYIYVRANNGVAEEGSVNAGEEYRLQYFFPQIIEKDGKTKIIANQYQGKQSKDGLYSSGFVTLANAFSGFTVTAYGHSYGNPKGGSMNSQAYGAKRIWHRYTSRTGPNGTIQTTSEGNYGGTLDDTSDSGKKSTVLDPGTYVVTKGKTVTYTMTPDNKYRISKLYVKNANGILREIRYKDRANPQPLYNMTEEEAVEAFTDAAGNEATLRALANGTFILKMPYANADEEVYVTWEPTVGELTVNKETVTGDSTFNYTITASKTEEVTEYSAQEIGSIWYIKNLETDTYEYGSSFHSDFTPDGTTADLADKLPTITLTDRVAVTTTSHIWKTDKTFADLGITDGVNDSKYVYVNFNTAANATHGDTLSDFIGNVYGTETEERIRFYLVTETPDTVTTYWNFVTEEEQTAKPDPEAHAFSITTEEGSGQKKFELPVNYTYVVTEGQKDKWELVSINGDKTLAADGMTEGIITEKEPTKTETFLNSPLHDLTVRKETIGNVSGSFPFRIRIWDAGEQMTYLDLSSLGGTPTGSEGEYEFTVANNQSLVIPNIPHGYFYTVHEMTPTGWKLISVNDNTSDVMAKGKMTKNETAVFLNEAYLYNLTVSKTVTGNMGSQDKAFGFNVTIPYFTGKTVSASKTLHDGTSESVELAFNTNGIASFTLTHGDSIVIPGIFYGSTYALTETNAIGYTTSSTVTYTEPGEGEEIPPVERSDDYTGKTIPAKAMYSDHIAAYVNDLEVTVPTGRWAGIAPAVLMIIIGAASLLCFGKRRKKA